MITTVISMKYLTSPRYEDPPWLRYRPWVMVVEGRAAFSLSSALSGLWCWTFTLIAFFAFKHASPVCGERGSADSRHKCDSSGTLCNVRCLFAVSCSSCVLTFLSDEKERHLFTPASALTTADLFTVPSEFDVDRNISESSAIVFWMSAPGLHRIAPWEKMLHRRCMKVGTPV